jgi:carboxymethylenebutenolidase
MASPADGGPGVLVLPSWWGLKPFFKQMCDRLAEQGYAALAPDYYGGRVAATIAEAEQLQQQAEGDPDAMGALITAARQHLAAGRPGKPLGILGFSMGTDWAVITAARQPGVAAVALFYGGYIADFSSMRSHVLIHCAELDKWFPLDTARQMEREMKAAGVGVTFYLYPGAEHWFMESDRPEYDPAAAGLAWQRTLDFLDQTLK